MLIMLPVLPVALGAGDAAGAVLEAVESTSVGE
jgi:hypothetical protein